MKNSLTRAGAAAAELALKAYTLESDPEMIADLGGDSVMQQISESADLTEAPEDAVCSLVIDLMHYCEREKIDWTHEVLERARGRFQTELAARSLNAATSSPDKGMRLV